MGSEREKGMPKGSVGVKVRDSFMFSELGAQRKGRGRERCQWFPVRCVPVGLSGGYVLSALGIQEDLVKL